MNGQIILVLSVLMATIVLFVTEKLRIDIIAILILLVLALSRLVTPAEALSGFASNAVISMAAVMVLGYGLDRSGFTDSLIKPIIKLSGSGERGIIGVISMTVGGLSAFMQNIGATALFIPAVRRISTRLEIPSSRLFMPMGFAAILGGTLTLVGSGPLIILNDLLDQGGLAHFGLFSVTPVGFALLTGGILYFLIFGKYVLPGRSDGEDDVSQQRKVIEAYNLSREIDAYRINSGSPLAGKTYEETGLWSEYHINLMALSEGREIQYAPWRSTRLAEGQELALLGSREGKRRLLEEGFLEEVGESEFLDRVRSDGEMIFAELMLPNRSAPVGKTIREIAIRKNYNVEPIMIDSAEGDFRGDISDVKMSPGCTFIVYGHAAKIKTMADDLGFIPVTPLSDSRPECSKPLIALACFLASIAAVIFGVSLPISLASGALLMILLGVISIDDAYRAIDWKTVVLIAGLIPLGVAMDKTGAAKLIASWMISLLEGKPAIVIYFSVGLLSTLFSLFMSNVAATVLLVPLVIIIGNISGINPRALAVLVALCAANSFILPTHQVNALVMTPGRYRNRDYIKAGSIMTVLFLLIAVPIVYMIF